jgi:lysozyme
LYILKIFVFLLFVIFEIDNDVDIQTNQKHIETAEIQKATKVSKQAIELIKKFEGACLNPLHCSEPNQTIGFGTTSYENNIKVLSTDPVITKYRAIQLLQNSLAYYEKWVDAFVRDDITQNQFDALVCFTYNVGIGSLKSSTLLKLINTDPTDPKIKDEFLRWNKASGIILKGLSYRRQAEADLYFKDM